MKKELAAGALLLLLIAAAIWNVHALDARCAALDALVTRAETCWDAGDDAGAAAALQQAGAGWQRMRAYARAVLPHDATDALTEAFDEAQSAVHAADDAAAQQLHLLHVRIAALTEGEHVSPQSIF